MILHIDLPWLLDVQERFLPDHITVSDFSALGAAVERHRFAPVTLGHEPDAAWRAAALMHTILRLEPLPTMNPVFACMVVGQYMHQSGEGINPPYGAIVELAKEIDDKLAGVFQVAERIRAWKI
ncbi:toxin Doc [Streptacidiphilus sp. N1-12]|uniref:Toxin Doc n=2 Tax=Streptacidiphilus alkalitolerans TaxID=3342712 RepID=A0ABV6VDD8_9ACTN